MTLKSLRFSLSRAAVLAAGLAVAIGGQPAGAQATRPAGNATATATNAAADRATEAQTIDLVVGQAKSIDAPWPVKRVAVNDPTVADVDLSSPRRVQLKGRAVGVTEVTLTSEHGDTWEAHLDVRADVSRLQGQLRKLFGNDSIEVVQAEDVLVIKGNLAHAEDAVQLRQFLQLAKVNYFDLTNVAGLQQVQLQVKVAEVSRTATRMLSADFAASDFTASLAVNNGGSTTFSPANPVGNLSRSLPGGTSIFGTGAVGSVSFEYFLKALVDNQYVRLLAEPTLVAKSGQEAQFLAGGQIPIPVAHVGGGSGTTDISVEYKDFGIRLRFTPTVLGNGRIELKVRPEISQLSDVGALVVLGTRIPSLLTRNVETTLEVQSGQTFAMAGLLDQRDNGLVSKVPVLGDLPVLGPMFRSVRYQHDDTEMLVLVTASLVDPSSADLNPPLPGAFHDEPNDWELFVEGRLDGKSRAHVAPGHQERLKKLGLDQLRGPGAWANYDAQPKALAGQKSKDE